MTKARKQIVDWFPHRTNHGQTIFILEETYGNDGYAFWFKLLEVLGNKEGHFIDMNDPRAHKYLAAKCRVSTELCLEILNLLYELDAIDRELWKEKIIWCDNFTAGLGPLYRNRNIGIPVKPVIQRKKSGSSRVDRDNQRGLSDKVVEVVEVVERESKNNAPPENGDAASFYVSKFFEVTQTYRQKLAIEYPAMTDQLLLKEFSRMEDWLTDNPKPKRANGNLKNPKLFIKNWLDRVIINPQIRHGPPLSKADQVTASNLAAAERVLKKWENHEPN